MISKEQFTVLAVITVNIYKNNIELLLKYI